MIKNLLKRLILWSGVHAYIDAIKAENDELKDCLKRAKTHTTKLSDNLANAIQARDTWRDTAIGYRQSEQYYFKKYDELVENLRILIRFDLSRKSGIVDMERAEEGEYVKWKAVNDSVTP